MTIYATHIFILGTDGKLSLGIMYSAFGVGSVLGTLMTRYFNRKPVPTQLQPAAGSAD